MLTVKPTLTLSQYSAFAKAECNTLEKHFKI